jgi:hypothetical protein
MKNHEGSRYKGMPKIDPTFHPDFMAVFLLTVLAGGGVADGGATLSVVLSIVLKLGGWGWEKRC